MKWEAISKWDLGAWDFALGLVGLVISFFAALFANSAKKAAKKAAKSQRLQSNFTQLVQRLDGVDSLLRDLEDAQKHNSELLARSVIRRWTTSSGQIQGLVSMVDCPPSFADQMSSFDQAMKVVGEWCQYSTYNLDNGDPTHQATIMLRDSMVELVQVSTVFKTTIEMREHDAE